MRPRKPRIVIVGSLNIDIVASMQQMPRVGETIRGDALHLISGGKGANQAVGCSKLTAETMMIGCIGDDIFGEMIQNRLSKYGVNIQAVETVPGVSSGAAIIMHTPENNSISIVDGANRECSVQLVEKYRELIADADVLLVQLEIPISTVDKALHIAKQAGVTTILNPAPAAELPDSVKRHADYLTPNETEWELLSGKPCVTEAELKETIAAWESQYLSKVIVTRGDKGCAYLDGDELKHVTAPPVQVVDTTGAGDAFNAALAYGLSIFGDISLREVLRFAVTYASLSVRTFGAQEGMPSLEEVLEAISEPTTEGS